MSKKLFLLTSFVLVLGLALTNVARGVDPDLLGWWKFDEGSGTTARDSSGKGNDGTLQGNPQWVAGKIGGALEFDGNGDYVDCGASLAFNINTNITVTCWIKVHQLDKSWQAIVGQGDNSWRLHRSSSSNNIAWGTNGLSPKDLTGSVNVNDGQWHHIAGVYDGTQKRLYMDGNLDASSSSTGNINNSSYNVNIGENAQATGRYWDGLIDDVRVYNRVLTQEEIQQVMIGIPPGTAFDPSPADEETDVPREVVLSWTPGEFAPPVNGHKVYFSEKFNDVNDGVGGIMQDANSYAPPQRLNLSTTYYWRVDEVNGPPDHTVFEGKVWSFKTELFTYPIENITATASSGTLAKGPENTINGSGLDESGLLHGKDGDDAMWLSDAAGPQPTWIEFQFEKVYKLYELWVWNSNEFLEPMVGFGFKDVTIEYSVNGTDYTTLGTTHQFARAPGTPDYPHNTTVDFGSVGAKHVRLTANSNWGGILNQFGLSEVRFLHIPVHARNPYPDSGATGVDVDAVLSWRAGREAASHNVYFSADEQAVIDETISPVSIPAGSSYAKSATGPLDLSKSYYWKVNEVNEAETPTTWQGHVWNFITQEYLVVDNFESYNDLNPEDPESNRIFLTWIDGYGVATNGSVVGNEISPFCEQTIVHGGKQSMPLSYSNTGGAAYSEAELPLSPPQNWTQAGAATLVLYFHGAEGNTGQLYIKVDGSKVVYDGDVGDIAKVEWKQWNIDLASLGVDLQSVTKLVIGVDGNGATGTLYVDDIRLYGQAPQPEAP
ncbi:MAG: LamG-like jellyroll fold domain-containing protein [Planctomycetota bacterium]|jgi:hypothetical protein